ncbi:MAG: tRNA 5-hydroxyuridine modification protein YegQ [Natronospirillum sp.]|uniref:prephenate-dependent tRNA uridine(34) hydroxylase TrhP n=1 Tax=Natronospirillum sp. TaxID=2812955 RepID=UPI0025E196E9|nr:tRNA 5-hydroxyuridine modification protein YegQ [Natronospirillum sp.]MCH8552831.1 tRNA 5-hydroxyuridine modification protein YegQ [Natronospirillum sp.]
MQRPELLSPAGTLRNMRYAFAYGADAVYAGQPRYSLRVRENDFTLQNLEIGIREAHEQGKQFYLASNIAPHNAKIKTYLKDMAPVIDLQPDALIMSDPGLIMLVREAWPDMPIHLSVQANAVNWATVKFWHRQGVERVILSRELSLDEVEDIRHHVPEMELEVFVHGALCIAYSGRCLLSGYLNRRDPNQGTCTNACRWEYKTHEGKTDITGDIIPKDPAVWTPQQDRIASDSQPQAPVLGEGAPVDGVWLLEDPRHPGEQMPAWEDEHGTYIMNSKDLRAVQHIERLTRIGVHSLKIEGRTKSHYYTARTAQTYRQAITDAVEGRPFNPDLLYQLDGLANRGYTEGFYRRHTHDSYQNYTQGRSVSTRQQFVAEAEGLDGERLLLRAKNKFGQGDWVELMTPEGNQRFQVEDVRLQKNGRQIDEVPGSDYRVSLAVPAELPASAGAFGLLMRDL